MGAELNGGGWATVPRFSGSKKSSPWGFSPYPCWARAVRQGRTNCSGPTSGRSSGSCRTRSACAPATASPDGTRPPQSDSSAYRWCLSAKARVTWNVYYDQIWKLWRENAMIVSNLRINGEKLHEIDEKCPQNIKEFKIRILYVFLNFSLFESCFLLWIL